MSEKTNVEDPATILQVANGGTIPTSKGDVSDSFSSRLLQVVRIALPAAGNSLLNFAATTITLMFVGQMLGVVNLAQYAIGNTVFNVTGWSLGIGLATAIDTLVAQAYGRDKLSPEIGDTLQRTLLVNYIACIPIITFFMFSDGPLILMFGEEIGAGAAQLLHCSPCSLLVQTTSMVLTRVLQAQKQAQLPLYSTVMATVLCPIFCYFLVPRGLCATIWAVTFANLGGLLVNVGIVVLHPKVVVRMCPWPSPHLLDRDRMYAHLRIAIPAMCAICSEWWSFEVLQLVAAQLGTRAVAGLNIILNITLILFAIPCGLAQATAVLVGNSLGSNKPEAAFGYFRFILRMLIVFAACTSFILMALRSCLAALYTADQETAVLVSEAIPIIVALNFVDSAQTTMQGVFRGVGRQDQLARVVLMSLWLVGVPLAAIFALALKLGFCGIFIGFVLGLLVEVPLLVRAIRSWDWDALAAKAAKLDTAATPPPPAAMIVNLSESICSAQGYVGGPQLPT